MYSSNKKKRLTLSEPYWAKLCSVNWDWAELYSCDWLVTSSPELSPKCRIQSYSSLTCEALQSQSSLSAGTPHPGKDDCLYFCLKRRGCSLAEVSERTIIGSKDEGSIPFLITTTTPCFLEWHLASHNRVTSVSGWLCLFNKGHVVSFRSFSRYSLYWPTTSPIMASSNSPL